MDFDKQVAEIVQARIEAEVAAALAKDPELLIKGIVKTALLKKKDQYSRTTVVQDMIQRMIHDEAQEAIKAWVEENRPMIRARVNKALTLRHSEHLDSFANAVMEGLAENLRVSVTIKPADW